MSQLNLTTTCNELNWIIGKSNYVCDDSFDGKSWSEFVFWGRINPNMMREITRFLSDKHLNTQACIVSGVEIDITISYGKEHFHFIQYH